MGGEICERNRLVSRAGMDLACPLRYFDAGSSRASSPRRTMSDKSSEVKTLVIDAILKTVLPLIRCVALVASVP
jgi:hypothetical protein